MLNHLETHSAILMETKKSFHLVKKKVMVNYLVK